ncbi:uncharacterized protein LOC125246438 isoform X2 [Megalobrama amblycephala]|uniref:uncharacterized protein LOC125246438 isoform X2 n=1 Tax=Megalobrama amblycephala TaxID=75352 RepID=UPI002013E297|nr:uncharacterized protein LOC125246438 isoform X2 [Megalobrama amblycephala]
MCHVTWATCRSESGRRCRASSKTKELNTALKSLQKKLQHNEEMKGEFEKTVQHIKSQAEHTERQIKQQFEKLHQFLRDEEEATITALREEEDQKKQMMKEKLEEMNRHISALSHTIKDMEEMMKANDVCFLKEFPVSMERVQSSQPDPQMASGALIHVPRYLGNLPFRVWKKMQDIVQNTPVILDPNTANRCLFLSDDLTSVRDSENKQPLPDNPERFDHYLCVLGSEGFNSGTHCWDVEVKESKYWILGVTTASNQRKGDDFYSTDVWSVWYNSTGLSLGSGVLVKRKLDHVRVNLDYDGGTLSFSDPVTNTHLHTFTTTFTDTLFPFFRCLGSLRILAVNSTSGVNEDHVFIISGETVHLPCNNDLPDCKSPTWTYSNTSRRSATVELIDRGIKNKDTERHERLSLGSDCSLNIKNVTKEDHGLYTCRQYVNGEQQGTDAIDYLHVLHVSVSPSSSSSSSSSQTEISPGRSVTLSCQMYSFAGFSCDQWIRSVGLQLLWVNQAGVDLKTDSRYQILFSSDHCNITLTTTLLNEDDNREWRCQLTLRNKPKTSVRYTVKYSASETEVSVTAGSLFRVIVIIVEMAVFAAPTVILLQIICARRAGRKDSEEIEMPTILQ